MRTLVLAFAFLGPIALPVLLRANSPRLRERAIWGITNLTTFLPMVAMILWLRFFPDSSCRAVNPGVACDGIPADSAWLAYAMIAGALAVWGFLASMAATAFVFRKK